jgi:hypothetical protein
MQRSKEENRMYVVTLKKPLPGIRSTVFVFHTQEAADEFASCIHFSYTGAQTHTEPAGEPQEVFPEWSF